MPVTKLESSEARNSAALATSSGSPIRPIGMVASILSMVSAGCRSTVAAGPARTHHCDFHKQRSRSACQDDFAERPILDQITQGFARLTEAIEPVDDRLGGSSYDQMDEGPPPCG